MTIFARRRPSVSQPGVVLQPLVTRSAPAPAVTAPPPPPPSPPEALFSFTPSSGSVGTTVAFTNLSTGTINTYAWDFDGNDVTDSTLENPPPFAYANAGTYTPKLTVTGPGGSSTYTSPTSISIAPPGWDGCNDEAADRALRVFPYGTSWFESDAVLQPPPAPNAAALEICMYGDSFLALQSETRITRPAGSDNQEDVYILIPLQPGETYTLETYIPSGALPGDIITKRVTTSTGRCWVIEHSSLYVGFTVTRVDAGCFPGAPEFTLFQTFYGENAATSGTGPPRGAPAAARLDFLQDLLVRGQARFDAGSSGPDYDQITSNLSARVYFTNPILPGVADITATVTTSSSANQLRCLTAPNFGRWSTSLQAGQTMGDPDAIVHPFSGYIIVQDNITFLFSKPITAFGAFMTDLGDFNGQVWAALRNAVTQVEEIIQIPHSLPASDGSLHFWGFRGVTPIDQIRFYCTYNAVGALDVMGFDDIIVGTYRGYPV